MSKKIIGLVLLLCFVSGCYWSGPTIKSDVPRTPGEPKIEFTKLAQIVSGGERLMFVLHNSNGSIWIRRAFFPNILLCAITFNGVVFSRANGFDNLSANEKEELLFHIRRHLKALGDRAPEVFRPLAGE